MTLDDVLMLVGRLDDAPGFDTARQRFRRFVQERMTDGAAARLLVEQCQHALSDQHRRALQDIVTLLGRRLGFQTAFADYLPAPDQPKHDGYWRSSGRMDIALQIWTDRPHAAAHASAPGGVASGAASRRWLLCLLTPSCAARAHLDDLFKTTRPESSTRFATIRSMLAVSDLVDSGRLTHDDVVRSLESGSDLEFVVELLQRPAGIGRTLTSPSASALRATDGRVWIASIVGDAVAAAEHIVALDAGVRRELEWVDDGAPELEPRAGDSIRFWIQQAGIVGRCVVRFVGERQPAIRQPGRVTRILHLDEVALHLDAPLHLPEEVYLRLRAQRTRGRSGWWLTPLSRREFTDANATHGRDGNQGEAAPPPGDSTAGTRPRPPISTGDSRSSD